MKNRTFRKYAPACFGLLVLVVLVNLLRFWTPLWTSQLWPFSNQPLILFWAKQYHSIDWKFNRLSNGDGGCDISFDRRDLYKADAVVFFMKSCNPKDRPPPQSRRQNQAYVWFSHESPWTTLNFYGHDLKEFRGYFNWTMTYRTDSDVIAAMWPTPAMDYLMHRIGRTDDMLNAKLAENTTLSIQEYSRQMKVLMKKKQNLIAWIVSNCQFTNGAKKRLHIVKSFEDQNIKLDKYGKCVDKPLPTNFTTIFETLTSYKFYLAFENSIHCQDYLTEKTLYNCFISGAVPVIHGPTKKDVEKILPKGSYIFLEDFENMKNLTDYLQYLDINDTAYMEYFQWWMDPGAQTFPRFGFNFGPSYVPRNLSLPHFNTTDLQDDWQEFERFGLYHLCRKLKRGDHIYQNKSIENIAGWWYSEQPPECVGS